MRKWIAVGLAVLFAAAMASYTAMAQGMRGSRGGGGGGSRMGGGMMGPAGTRGPSGTMAPSGTREPGRMQQGSGPGQGPHFRDRAPGAGQPMTIGDAETLMQNRIARTGNPNLKLGSMKEESDHFVAEVMTKDNSLVDRLRIDKETGIIQPMR